MIKLHAPYLDSEELDYLKACLESGWIASSGDMVDEFERSIANFSGAAYCISLINGTTALSVGLMLSGVKKGDLVIAPNLTFVATINALEHVGAKPVFIDSDSDTWQMDLDLLEEFLEEYTYLSNVGRVHKKTNKRIGAIVVVHLLGEMNDMDRVKSISKKYSIPIIEDAAQAFGSEYKGKQSGTFGLMGTISFNGNKIISTGGGGVLLTNNESLYYEGMHLIQQAKTSKFEYMHDKVGYNYRMPSLLAAVGRAQLNKFPEIARKKQAIFKTYRYSFMNYEEFKFQQEILGSSGNNWLFTFLVPRNEKLRKFLMSNNIEARPFYIPMNRLPMYTKDIYISKKDNAYKIFSHAISIPSSASLKEEEQAHVINMINKFYSK